MSSINEGKGDDFNDPKDLMKAGEGQGEVQTKQVGTCQVQVTSQIKSFKNRAPPNIILCGQFMVAILYIELVHQHEMPL